MAKTLESKRGQGRISAMRFLFEWELNPIDDLQEAMERHFKYLKIKTGVAGYARKLIEGTLLHMQQVDKIIQDHLANWSLKRLTLVDRTVLRVGVYEMMYIGEVPAKVTINEMVEISKQYGTVESAGFSNGVLDAIRKSLEKMKQNG